MVLCIPWQTPGTLAEIPDLISAVTAPSWRKSPNGRIDRFTALHSSGQPDSHEVHASNDKPASCI
jgi:hypothetical protein